MADARPLLVATENKQKLPLLIIDKKGFIGGALAERTSQEFLSVLVSGRELDARKNIVHIPYRRKIPMIPDNRYSHIFIVYNGEREILEMLPSFVKKVNQTNARLFFILPLGLNSEQLLRKLSHQFYNPLHILVYGEVFDDNTTEPNMVNVFLHQARASKTLEIPNEGLGRVYPVLLEDVVLTIAGEAFSHERHGRLRYIFPKQEYTDLSVARMFQKAHPDINLNFRKARGIRPEYYAPAVGEYVFPMYDLEKKIRTLDIAKPAAVARGKSRKMRLPVQSKKTQYGIIAVISVVVLWLLPYVVTLVLAVVGAGALVVSFKDLENGRIQPAKQFASIALHAFNVSTQTSKGMVLLRDNFTENIDNGKRVAETELQLVSALELFQKVSDGKSTDPQKDFLQAIAVSKNTLIAVQKMQAEQQLPPQIAAKLAEIDDTLYLIENTMDTFPNIAGINGKKRYLLLFQNNMELRPGGGFIGSYGLIDIDRGKLGKLKIYDVYDADGQLTTHVEPPYGLRRYLGAAHWFMRDSNFDPDFLRDGVQAVNFLEMETGEKVDGVVAIDTDFLKKMLQVMGGVYVEDYKETVTPDNFYMLTQTHAEKGFFPGSTQKKDFLRALLNSILLGVTEGDRVKLLPFIQALSESIREKHLLFAFSDLSTQNLFTVNNLSSTLWDGREIEENKMLDYMGVIDANLGGNKANFYVQKSVMQSVVIDEAGNYKGTASVTYQNTSEKDSPFGGNYKNYLRFLLPEGVQLTSVAIDDKVIPTVPAIVDQDIYTRKNFVPPQELEIERGVEQGKAVIGFFFIVPTQSSKKVTITYELFNTINVENSSFVYDMKVFKQPGTKHDPYTLFLSYPSMFKPVKIIGGGTDVGGKINFQSDIATDKEFIVTFSKK